MNNNLDLARELLVELADTVELAYGIHVVDVRGYCLITHDCGYKELEHEDEYVRSHKHGCPESSQHPEHPWCNGWTVEPGVPELSEAASREGVAYLATVVDSDGRKKVVLEGEVSPEMVRAFMVHWAPDQGLTDIHGDFQKGFAAGYLSESKVTP